MMVGLTLKKLKAVPSIVFLGKVYLASLMQQNQILLAKFKAVKKEKMVIIEMVMLKKTAKKMSVCGVVLVRIFLHMD